LLSPQKLPFCRHAATFDMGHGFPRFGTVARKFLCRVAQSLKRFVSARLFYPKRRIPCLARRCGKRGGVAAKIARGVLLIFENLGMYLRQYKICWLFKHWQFLYLDK
jgi:hypothetical protein